MGLNKKKCVNKKDKMVNIVLYINSYIYIYTHICEIVVNVCIMMLLAILEFLPLSKSAFWVHDYTQFPNLIYCFQFYQLFNCTSLYLTTCPITPLFNAGNVLYGIRIDGRNGYIHLWVLCIFKVTYVVEFYGWASGSVQILKRMGL